MMKCPFKVTSVGGLPPTVVLKCLHTWWNKLLFLTRFVHLRSILFSNFRQEPPTLKSQPPYLPLNEQQSSTINHLVDRLPSRDVGAAHPMSLHCAECHGGRPQLLSWLAEFGTPGKTRRERESMGCRGWGLSFWGWETENEESNRTWTSWIGYGLIFFNLPKLGEMIQFKTTN